MQTTPHSVSLSSFPAPFPASLQDFLTVLNPSSEMVLTLSIGHAQSLSPESNMCFKCIKNALCEYNSRLTSKASTKCKASRAKNFGRMNSISVPAPKSGWTHSPLPLKFMALSVLRNWTFRQTSKLLDGRRLQWRASSMSVQPSPLLSLLHCKTSLPFLTQVLKWF